MPKTKLQDVIFTIIMVIVMVYAHIFCRTIRQMDIQTHFPGKSRIS